MDLKPIDLRGRLGYIRVKGQLRVTLTLVLSEAGEQLKIWESRRLNENSRIAET